MERKWEDGDICYIRTKSSRQNFVGVVTEVNDQGTPRVFFIKCATSEWMDAPMYMMPGTLVYIGRIPEGVYWDV